MVRTAAVIVVRRHPNTAAMDVEVAVRALTPITLLLVLAALEHEVIYQQYYVQHTRHRVEGSTPREFPPLLVSASISRRASPLIIPSAVTVPILTSVVIIVVEVVHCKVVPRSEAFPMVEGGLVPDGSTRVLLRDLHEEFPHISRRDLLGVFEEPLQDNREQGLGTRVHGVQESPEGHVVVRSNNSLLSFADGNVGIAFFHGSTIEMKFFLVFNLPSFKIFG